MPITVGIDIGSGVVKTALFRTEGGKTIRFVPRSTSDPYYEIQVYETGQVQTRADNRHDLFNALAWLAFPKTKARINAMHAAEIPRERETNGGRRGSTSPTFSRACTCSASARTATWGCATKSLQRRTSCTSVTPTCMTTSRQGRRRMT